jgi:hypothetical protein
MISIIPSRTISYLLMLGTVVVAGGCGSTTENGPEAELTLAKTATASGDNQSWSTGHNMPNPLRVIVSRLGLPVEGVAVTWAVADGNGYIAPLIAVTGADGISTARWGMGLVAGTLHATAAVPDAAGSPVTFTATAYPNFAHQVSAYAGNNQSDVPGATLSEPLILRVGDQFDNPFPGAQIEWVITSGEGTVSPIISVSDDAGLAQTFLTLGPTPGTVTILARFPGAETGPRATFTATATGP